MQAPLPAMAYARSVTVVDQTSSNLVLLADDAAKDSPFLDCVVGLSFLFREFVLGKLNQWR
jgi:hypothetical protein